MINLLVCKMLNVVNEIREVLSPRSWSGNMFVLAALEDIVTVEAKYFAQKFTKNIFDALNKKYANKVWRQTAFCQIYHNVGFTYLENTIFLGCAWSRTVHNCMGFDSRRRFDFVPRWWSCAYERFVGTF